MLLPRKRESIADQAKVFMDPRLRGDDNPYCAVIHLNLSVPCVFAVHMYGLGSAPPRQLPQALPYRLHPCSRASLR